MASVMAIISKAVFERDARGAKTGDVIAIDRYLSTQKRLQRLLDRRPTMQVILATLGPDISAGLTGQSANSVVLDGRIGRIDGPIRKQCRARRTYPPD